MALAPTTDLVGLLDCPIVDLYVGAKRKKFSVHQKLISNRSTFFNKAFNGPFKEGTENAVYLSEDDPAVVERFIAWLYSGIINPPPAESSGSAKDNDHKDTNGSAVNRDAVSDDEADSGDSDVSSDSDDSSDSGDSIDTNEAMSFVSKSQHYSHLYFFSEKYGIESLQNQAMDALSAVMTGKDYPNNFSVQEVYENTAPSSPLRKLTVKHLGYGLITLSLKFDRDYIAELCELGGDFVKDLMMECFAVKSRLLIRPPSEEPNCDYHVHSDGRRCGS